jgi:hypothetical protein
VLGAVNAELGGRWQLGRRLAGGWNEGAYLLIRGGGSRAVLKWRASDPERLLGARERVEAARARGWPAPAWLATGQAPAGGAWVVQEFIDGRTPPRLDDVVAEQMTRILGLQEAMFPGASGGWGQWAAGVVFEDWDGLRGRVASGVPGGSRIVAAVDAIAGACPPGEAVADRWRHRRVGTRTVPGRPGCRGTVVAPLTLEPAAPAHSYVLSCCPQAPSRTWTRPTCTRSWNARPRTDMPEVPVIPQLSSLVTLLGGIRRSWRPRARGAAPSRPKALSNRRCHADHQTHRRTDRRARVRSRRHGLSGGGGLGHRLRADGTPPALLGRRPPGPRARPAS